MDIFKGFCGTFLSERKINIVSYVKFLMEHQMGEEKIEQNIDRLDIFLFNSLGLGREDFKRVIRGLLKKRKISLEELAPRADN